MKKIFLFAFAFLIGLSLLGVQARPADAAVSLKRLSGNDRFLTAVAISQEFFPSNGSAAAVYLYNAEDPIDALAATPLTQITTTINGTSLDLRGPLFPVKNGNTLTAEVKAEIARVLPGAPNYGSIILLGGEEAVSFSAVDDLPTAGFATAGHYVSRYGGKNRFETAAILADAIRAFVHPIIPDMFVVNGYSTVDALAVAPLAAFQQSPNVPFPGSVGSDVILLTYKDAVPNETRNFVDGQAGGAIHIVGGTGVVSKNVAESLASRHWHDSSAYGRFDGKTRHDTARIIADRFTQNGTGFLNDGIGLVNGYSSADALPASALLAMKYMPMLYTTQATLSCATVNYLAQYRPQLMKGFVFGGSAVVVEAVKLDAEALIDGTKTPTDFGC
jgi:putative cell wall-binding protein